MSKILDIKGYEILDSRGNPTVEVEVTLECGIKERASVPSGASTGIYEALELRDNDKNRYNGKGVLKAVNNVNTIIKDNLIGKDSLNIEDIDDILITLDGTKDKSKLGANAILGVSLAVLKAACIYNNKELYEYVGLGRSMPKCMMNILNGGVHADNNLDIQEFMIVPNLINYKDNLRLGVEVFQSLKKVLKEEGYVTSVGDEGGFAPNIDKTSDALELISKAIDNAGYKLGKDVNIALDVAASELYKDGYYYLDKNKYTSSELVDYYIDLCNKYSIISIEDGLGENDYEGWKILTDKLSSKIMLVGDDLFVTNTNLFKKGIDMNIANSILIKLNQIGTVSETLSAIKMAKDNGYKTIISHRSGETTDTYIADLSVGLSCDYIKTGSLSRGERICKYNRLSMIENDINNKMI